MPKETLLERAHRLASEARSVGDWNTYSIMTEMAAAIWWCEDTMTDPEIEAALILLIDKKLAPIES